MCLLPKSALQLDTNTTAEITICFPPESTTTFRSPLEAELYSASWWNAAHSKASLPSITASRTLKDTSCGSLPIWVRLQRTASLQTDRLNSLQSPLPVHSTKKYELKIVQSSMCTQAGWACDSCTSILQSCVDCRKASSKWEMLLLILATCGLKLSLQWVWLQRFS